MKLLFFVVIFWIVCVSLATATLSPSDKKDKKKKEKEQPTASVDGQDKEQPSKDASPTKKDDGPKILAQSLDELGLLKVDVARKDLIKYYQGYASEKVKKNFEKPTLGFVTPWNNYGYDFAKEFAAKLDMVSPVWLQIRGAFKEQKGCFFTGTHDVDKGWMAELKKRNPAIKIVPRAIFEAWSPDEFHQLLSSETFMHRCITAIKSTTQQYEFDGIVIEIWLQAGQEFREEIIHFMGDLKVALNDLGKLAILVLPPTIRELNAQNQAITRKDFAEIASVVDYVTLMTYDYFHSGGRPGPTAPLPWVRANVEILTGDEDPNRGKILTGLNFYGYEFAEGEHPKPILGRDYVKMLKSYKPNIKWDTFGHENYIEFQGKSRGEKHIVFYPTLQSMKEKIDTARALGTGLMIWELGQGPRIFGELL